MNMLRCCRRWCSSFGCWCWCSFGCWCWCSFGCWCWCSFNGRWISRRWINLWDRSFISGWLSLRCCFSFFRHDVSLIALCNLSLCITIAFYGKTQTKRGTPKGAPRCGLNLFRRLDYVEILDGNRTIEVGTNHLLTVASHDTLTRGEVLRCEDSRRYD